VRHFFLGVQQLWREKDALIGELLVQANPMSKDAPNGVG
jgi:hypothetical protein